MTTTYTDDYLDSLYKFIEELNTTLCHNNYHELFNRYSNDTSPNVYDITDSIVTCTRALLTYNNAREKLYDTRREFNWLVKYNEDRFVGVLETLDDIITKLITKLSELVG